MGDEFVVDNDQNKLVINVPTTHNITFHKEDKEIGRLKWDDGVLRFKGEADDSAKVLFDFLKPFVDNYIKEKLSARTT